MTEIIVRILAGVLFVYSLVELIIMWIDWFRYKAECKRSGEYGKAIGYYFKFGLKAVIPGILGIFGLLMAALH